MKIFTSASLTGSVGSGGMHWPDDIKATFGNTAASPDATIEWDTASSPDTWLFTMPSMNLTQDVVTTGSPAALTLTGGAHTTLDNAEFNFANFDFSATAQLTGGGGAISSMRAMRIQTPTYSAAAGQNITAAIGLEISGPPEQGTNVAITSTQGVNYGFATGVNVSPTSAIQMGVTIPGIADGVFGATQRSGINVTGPLGGNLELGNQTGSLTNLYGMRFDSITCESDTNTRTVINPATLYIAGPWVAGTNVTFTNTPYAIWVDDGVSRFDGEVEINSQSGDTTLLDVNWTLSSYADSTPFVDIVRSGSFTFTGETAAFDVAIKPNLTMTQAGGGNSDTYYTLDVDNSGIDVTYDANGDTVIAAIHVSSTGDTDATRDSSSDYAILSEIGEVELRNTSTATKSLLDLNWQSASYTNVEGIFDLRRLSAITGVAGETAIDMVCTSAITVIEPSSGTFNYWGMLLDYSSIAVTADAGTSVFDALKVSACEDSDAGTVRAINATGEVEINVGNAVFPSALDINWTATGYTNSVAAIDFNRTGNITGVSGEVIADMHLNANFTLTEPGAGTVSYYGGLFNHSNMVVTADAGSSTTVAVAAFACNDSDVGESLAIHAQGPVQIVIQENIFPSALDINWTEGSYTDVTGVIDVVRSGNLTGSSPDQMFDMKIRPTLTLTEPGAGTFTYYGASIDMTAMSVTAGAGTSVVSALRLSGSSDADIGNSYALLVDSGDVRIDEGLIRGHTELLSVIGGGATPQFQNHGTDINNRLIMSTYWANDEDGGTLILAKSRSGTIGSYTIVQDGDNLGEIAFAADDGTGIDVFPLGFRGKVDDPSPGADDIGAAFVWEQAAAGLAKRETMRLHATGVLEVTNGVATAYSTANVSDPPTDAELDSAFGDPTTLRPGFIGILDDNDAGADGDVWFCTTTGTAGEWFYQSLTKAV